MNIASNIALDPTLLGLTIRRLDIDIDPIFAQTSEGVINGVGSNPLDISALGPEGTNGRRNVLDIGSTLALKPVELSYWFQLSSKPGHYQNPQERRGEERLGYRQKLCPKISKGLSFKLVLNSSFIPKNYEKLLERHQEERFSDTSCVPKCLIWRASQELAIVKTTL